ncbi:ATP-binding protein [bacterium]|nr:ATP-binding protein [bacterium]
MPGVNAKPVFENFPSALDYLAEIATTQRVILVIDEYPYLASSENAISSILQTCIDQKLKQGRLFLILCGSSMSFMELGYQSPLYGRRTAQIKLQAFDYLDTSRFYPPFSLTDQALLYGITGGIPQYIDQFDPTKSMKENVIEKLLDDTSYLFEEPGNLLKQELREPQVYNAIITAIAKGSSRLNDISLKAGLMTSTCSIYLQTLISLGIVRKEHPAGDEKSRKSIYLLEDHLFYFWYRFISSHISNIVTGKGSMLYELLIEPRLNDYMGWIFEKICQEYLLRLNGSEHLPFFFTSIGRWWGTNPEKKCQVEMDLVAKSREEHKILVAECKYRNEPLGMAVLKELTDKSHFLRHGVTQFYYFLFSKSGFSFELIEQAKEDPFLRLVDLAMLYATV